MHIISSKSSSQLIIKLVKILDAKFTQDITNCFSNQEFFIRLQNDCKKILIEFPKHNSVNDSIIDLALILDSLSSYDIKSIILLIPYMPYSRQDKRVRVGDSLGIKVIADILNSFNINKIITFDLHSTNSIDFFKAQIINLTPDIIFFEQLKKHSPQDTIVIAPDQGSLNRAKAVAKIIGCDVISTTKKRFNDSIDHQLEVEIKKDNIVIIDDIIDSGKTIASLIKQIKTNDIKSIYIYTTHILNPYSISSLLDNNLVKKIYTTTEIENTHKKIISSNIYQKLLDYL
jgi:ribose-phosphate pyrophosphokinase